MAFFQAVRAVLAKRAPSETKTKEELDIAVRQIVSRAVISDEVVDIFAAAGLEKPDISILSDEFLAEVRGDRGSVGAQPTIPQPQSVLRTAIGETRALHNFRRGVPRQIVAAGRSLGAELLGRSLDANVSKRVVPCGL